MVCGRPLYVLILMSSAADRASSTDSPFEAAGVSEDAKVFDRRTSLYLSVSLSARDLISVHAYSSKLVQAIPKPNSRPH